MSFCVDAPPSARPTREAWALLAIVCVGAALRAVCLDGFRLTHWDEGSAWGSAQFIASLGQHHRYALEQGPPLMPLLYAVATSLLDGSQRAAVFVNVALSTLTIPLIYAIARPLAGRGAALWSAVLAAGAVYHVAFARCLLTDAGYLFFLCAHLACALRWITVRREGWLLAAGLAVAALQYVKYNGFIAAAPVSLILLLDAARGGGNLRELVRRLSLVWAPVALAIALNVLALQLTGNLQKFLDHYGQFIAHNTPTPQALLRTLAWAYWPRSPWPGLGALALLALGFALGLRRLREPGWLLLYAAFVLYVGFAFSYYFYLRLWVPPLGLGLVFQGVALAAMARRLALPARAAAGAQAALLAGLVLANASLFGDFHPREFDGYSKARKLLATLPPDLTRIGAVQGQMSLLPSGLLPINFMPEDEARALLAQASDEVVLMTDLAAYSRLARWRFTADMREALAPYRIGVVRNRLGMDVMQNHLAATGLFDLVGAGPLATRTRRIEFYRLPRETLRSILAPALGAAQ